MERIHVYWTCSRRLRGWLKERLRMSDMLVTGESTAKADSRTLAVLRLMQTAGLVQVRRKQEPRQYAPTMVLKEQMRPPRVATIQDATNRGRKDGPPDGRNAGRCAEGNIRVRRAARSATPPKDIQAAEDTPRRQRRPVVKKYAKRS